MKKITFILLLTITYLNPIFSQDNSDEKKETAILVDGKLNIDSLYQKKDDYLIFSGVHKFDSLTQAELVKRVKNWASINFVNLKEVLVSETEDQLVLNYITSSFYAKSLGMKTTIDWYIRLLIQFKDGKIKCSYIDDGNVRMTDVNVSARTYKLKDYFKEKDGIMVAQKMHTIGLVNLHNTIINSFNSLKESIEKKETSKDKDW